MFEEQLVIEHQSSFGGKNRKGHTRDNFGSFPSIRKDKTLNVEFSKCEEDDFRIGYMFLEFYEQRK